MCLFRRKKIKTLEKEASKNRNKGNKKPTGFASPMNVTPELCKFMKAPEGSKHARTEVTKFLIQYIKENKLQNPQQKKEIKPDKALSSLLDIKKNFAEGNFTNNALLWGSRAVSYTPLTLPTKRIV